MRDTVSIGDLNTEDLKAGVKTGLDFLTAAANPLGAGLTAAQKYFAHGTVPATSIPQPAVPAKASIPVKKDPVLSKALASGNEVYQALRNAGISDPAASFATFQAYHETKAFTDPKFLNNNNASGIKFAGQAGAYKILNSNLNYAGFNSLADWARSMAHEITKKSNPAGAATLEDYVARLKPNGYYEDSYNNYLHGLKAARLVLRTLPAAEWDYNSQMDYNANTGVSTPKKDSLEWNDLPLWAKGGIIGVGALLAISAIKS